MKISRYFYFLTHFARSLRERGKERERKDETVYFERFEVRLFRRFHQGFSGSKHDLACVKLEEEVLWVADFKNLLSKTGKRILILIINYERLLYAIKKSDRNGSFLKRGNFFWWKYTRVVGKYDSLSTLEKVAHCLTISYLITSYYVVIYI